MSEEAKTKERSEDKVAEMKLARAIWTELNTPEGEGVEIDKEALKAGWNENKGKMKSAVRKALRKMDKSGWALVKKD